MPVGGAKKARNEVQTTAAQGVPGQDEAGRGAHSGTVWQHSRGTGGNTPGFRSLGAPPDTDQHCTACVKTPLRQDQKANCPETLTPHKTRQRPRLIPLTNPTPSLHRCAPRAPVGAPAPVTASQLGLTSQQTTGGWPTPEVIQPCARKRSLEPCTSAVLCLSPAVRLDTGPTSLWGAAGHRRTCARPTQEAAQPEAGRGWGDQAPWLFPSVHLDLEMTTPPGSWTLRDKMEWTWGEPILGHSLGRTQCPGPSVLLGGWQGLGSSSEQDCKSRAQSVSQKCSNHMASKPFQREEAVGTAWSTHTPMTTK